MKTGILIFALLCPYLDSIAEMQFDSYSACAAIDSYNVEEGVVALREESDVELMHPLALQQLLEEGESARANTFLYDFTRMFKDTIANAVTEPKDIDGNIISEYVAVLKRYDIFARTHFAVCSISPCPDFYKKSPLAPFKTPAGLLSIVSPEEDSQFRCAYEEPTSAFLVAIEWCEQSGECKLVSLSHEDL